MTVLIPLPSKDFDPTETAVTWNSLVEAGYKVAFATPEGQPAKGDPIMITGAGLGILRFVLPANRTALNNYAAMVEDENFRRPIPWGELKAGDFTGLVLVGGHAQGVKEFLESSVLQKLVSEFFEADKPVGAICHGVVLAARSKREDGKSVLFNKRTTALLQRQELLAWNLTRRKMGDYYRTYPQTVEAEVKAALEKPEQFSEGPLPMFRDSPKSIGFGFSVRDGNYVSARWPGDTHKFANEFIKLLASRKA